MLPVGSSRSCLTPITHTVCELIGGPNSTDQRPVEIIPIAAKGDEQRRSRHQRELGHREAEAVEPIVFPDDCLRVQVQHLPQHLCGHSGAAAGMIGRYV